MDKRLKQMMLDGLFVEQAHHAQIEAEAAESYGFSAEGTNTLTDSFIGRIRTCIAEFNENTFLYLGGYISLPKVGDNIPARVNNEDVECIVDSINFIEGTILAHYTAMDVCYFDTTEKADNYTKTGNKGNYSDWNRGKTESYYHRGEYPKQYNIALPFDEF